MGQLLEPPRLARRRRVRAPEPRVARGHGEDVEHHQPHVHPRPERQERNPEHQAHRPQGPRRLPPALPPRHGQDARRHHGHERLLAQTPQREQHRRPEQRQARPRPTHPRQRQDPQRAQAQRGRVRVRPERRVGQPRRGRRLHQRQRHEARGQAEAAARSPARPPRQDEHGREVVNERQRRRPEEHGRRGRQRHAGQVGQHREGRVDRRRDRPGVGRVVKRVAVRQREGRRQPRGVPHPGVGVQKALQPLAPADPQGEEQHRPEQGAGSPNPPARGVPPESPGGGQRRGNGGGRFGGGCPGRGRFGRRGRRHARTVSRRAAVAKTFPRQRERGGASFSPGGGTVAGPAGESSAPRPARWPATRRDFPRPGTSANRPG